MYSKLDIRQVDLPYPELSYSLLKCLIINQPQSKDKEVLSTPETCKLELTGYKVDVERIDDVIKKLTELMMAISKDSLDGLTLQQVRVFMINRYTRDMKKRFDKLENCTIESKEKSISYQGRRAEVS